ncbi:MAG: type 1 glutamine amidotransferase [Chloroflexota bacterium]
MKPNLTVLHLYPTLLNLYGDRGNIITLRQRCQWREIELSVCEIGLGQSFPDSPVDMVFMGGDQDREQAVVVDDLRSRHRNDLFRLAHDGVPILAVCGSYQLLQRYYRPAEGPDLIGLGLVNAYTVHPGPGTPRCVGNIVVDTPFGEVVGFENHGGRTYLEGSTQPLGTVIRGFGNNGSDGTEGAQLDSVFCSYVHGSLLPKNPGFADHLLRLALARRYPSDELAPLDDAMEDLAHASAVRRSYARVR